MSLCRRRRERDIGMRRRAIDLSIAQIERAPLIVENLLFRYY